MRLSLRPAKDEELAFCERLHQQNMGAYLATRSIPWEPRRFLASWSEFENLMISADAHAIGLLRLVPESSALGLRDIQIVPERQGQGIGSWAMQQAQAMAASRGYSRLQLRVYEENPAKALYARLGFKVQSIADGTVHMAWAVPPNHSFKPTPLRGAA